MASFYIIQYLDVIHECSVCGASFLSRWHKYPLIHVNNVPWSIALSLIEEIHLRGSFEILLGIWVRLNFCILVLASNYVICLCQNATF